MVPSVPRFVLNTDNVFRSSEWQLLEPETPCHLPSEVLTADDRASPGSELRIASSLASAYSFLMTDFISVICLQCCYNCDGVTVLSIKS